MIGFYIVSNGRKHRGGFLERIAERKNMEEKKEERVTREERFERRGNGWKEMDGGVHEG